MLLSGCAAECHSGGCVCKFVCFLFSFIGGCIRVVIFFCAWLQRVMLKKGPLHAEWRDEHDGRQPK